MTVFSLIFGWGWEKSRKEFKFITACCLICVVLWKIVWQTTFLISHSAELRYTVFILFNSYFFASDKDTFFHLELTMHVCSTLVIWEDTREILWKKYTIKVEWEEIVRKSRCLVESSEFRLHRLCPDTVMDPAVSRKGVRSDNWDFAKKSSKQKIQGQINGLYMIWIPVVTFRKKIQTERK